METKVNEIAISYSGSIKTKLLPKVSSSRDAANLLYKHWDKQNIELYESFKMLLLNNSNKVKGIYTLSKGGITGTLVDVRIVFAVVLKSVTTSIILAHNHPSGTLKPSQPDKMLTEKIKKAGKLFDIKILDHIILSPDGEYFSFADDGIL
ncbi:JAB domain-containing protein [Salegentibacter maritimus]|uniref:JAB domain-containing protein n=1 Tax=Salegentibacter maritimus TaxID=2794347 RepID=A0ABS0TF70_9FLAO|nr:JAB domain-containing protein [Salegentibacter maritimus]MBI6119642.1 JAB domain-containing protein [Salegentibacter maritimus]